MQVLGYRRRFGKLPARLEEIGDPVLMSSGRRMELLPTSYGFLIYSRGERGDGDAANWESVRATFRLKLTSATSPGSRS
jgi:hypothetical protein